MRGASLLVHHGGIGTTARALEANVPQIISPQAFDQPDNGDRISRLGVGTVIVRAKLSGATLAGAARSLLQRAEVREALRELSGRVRSTDGVALAADSLERQFVARRTVPASSIAAGAAALLWRSSQANAA